MCYSTLSVIRATY